MLTIKELKEMEPNTIFASGIGLINHPWPDLATSVIEGGTLEADGWSTKVKWVAIRGGIYDWAIYHSMDSNIILDDHFNNPIHLDASEDRIAKIGAKLHNPEKIREFISCNDEAFEMYRH